ncbi:vacuolar protein sorting-associated protein 54-like [Pecten maximus]|uniref:vacuolar protein sorting-associated protein 54-like n=1 Tax=Pecten maximus TaxID=6579 RepID=UPI001457F69F|nr:vacuolar protein sorting-associated protein 54-like [Pecten maximus]
MTTINYAISNANITGEGQGARPRRKCSLCQLPFKSADDFTRHLRDFHCSKEGGSFVCRYGLNNVCPSLPLEGVSDMDYENHIARDHVHSYQQHGIGQKNSTGVMASYVSDHNKKEEPSVVQDQHKWTIYKSCVNLPAALNDPLRSKREYDFFTKTWGQDFYERTEVPPSPYLIHISREHFQKYRHRISKRYKKHVHRTNQFFQESPGGETFLQQLEKNRAELQQIPKLFLLPNFELDNSDTFNAVFPWQQIESKNHSKSSSPTSSGPQSSKLLQEKLSHYLDIVEVHIAKQISTKSDAFFQAMSRQDKLQENMLQTCQTIKRLRDRVKTIDDYLAKGSLKIIKLYRTRANYAQLYNKLKMMATVHQTQPTIQLLLSTNEFVGALDLISTTQEVLSQELAGVHSFRHLGSQLAEMEKVIDRMLQEDFAKYVSSDLNRPVTDPELLQEEEKLVSLVFGMIRRGRYNFVDVYREEALTAVRATVKQTVVEAVSSADVDTDENASSLGDQMRLLDYNQWMDCLKQIFSNLLVHLNRVKTFHGVITDVVGITARKTHVPSPLASPTHNMESLSEASHLHVSVSEDAADLMISDADFVTVSSSLSDLLINMCDFSHDRCVKVIVARSKDGFLERLSSNEFVNLSRVVEGFVNDCEGVCGRRSASLRLSLQSQASRFVNRFHDERRTKLSLILDNERWKQADVPAEFQELVDHISKTGKLCVIERTSDADKKPFSTLSVDGLSYSVVGTVLMLFKMMVEYCQCVDDIPTAAPDLLTRLIELIKIFNSRTCQLVLGAGALQLVGLKTITTKNLALASRCLQLVVHYMPLVRGHFESHLLDKNKTMLKHFDQVKKDYMDHINEITNKLVSVMEGVVESQLVKWEVKAPMPSACFRSICKQITKMHEVVIDILPEDQIKTLFQSINQVFIRLVRLQLVKLDVCSNGGPQHALVTSDLAFYSGTFKTLRGLEALANNTNAVWDTS